MTSVECPPSRVAAKLSFAASENRPSRTCSGSFVVALLSFAVSENIGTVLALTSLYVYVVAKLSFATSENPQGREFADKVVVAELSFAVSKNVCQSIIRVVGGSTCLQL